jgi:hypothetical protein
MRDPLSDSAWAKQWVKLVVACESDRPVPISVSGDTTEFVLASWNLAQAWHPDRRPSPWEYLPRLAEDHRVQVFALQEAARPPIPIANSEPPADDLDLWRLPIPAADRNFCSAVVSLDDTLEFLPRRPIPVLDAVYGQFFACHPGQFSVVDLILGNCERVTVVSLYGMWDRLHEHGALYADASLHRAISDLTVFEVPRPEAR